MTAARIDTSCVSHSQPYFAQVRPNFRAQTKGSAGSGTANNPTSRSTCNAHAGPKKFELQLSKQKRVDRQINLFQLQASVPCCCAFACEKSDKYMTYDFTKF